jgi:hypothetical protein
VIDVSVQGDLVVFDVEGNHKMWALKSRLQIPLAHIAAVESDPSQVGMWWHGFRLFGTSVPGIFAAGTFFQHGELVFWDVRHPENTIIVSLVDERYKKLIIEVADPAATVSDLRDALRRQTGR